MQEVSLFIEPDDEDVEAAAIYVEGTIDAQSYRFLLDTGAGRSCIENDAYTAQFAAIGMHTASRASWLSDIPRRRWGITGIRVGA